MFKKFFTRKSASIGANAISPAGMRIYAIGDIHGRVDLLDKLLEIIDQDTIDADQATETRGQGLATTQQIIFLGDYVDRGADSRKVIDRLISLQQTRPETVFLKGNHEVALLDFIETTGACDAWLQWGGMDTLLSYGVENVWSLESTELADIFAREFPEEHKAFLSNLGLMYSLGDYLFVHAGVRPGVKISDQKEKDLLWIRNEFHNMAAADQPYQVIVHGHHPLKEPLDAGWRIAVDTNAVWSDKLTAVVLEERIRRFLSTQPEWADT